MAGQQEGIFSDRRAGQPRVVVHLDHGRSVRSWAEMHDRGLTWEETPYSYGLAAGHVKLIWSEDARESRLGRFVRRAQLKVLGFDLLHAWRNRKILLNCDVIWTHTEREHLAVAALFVLHRPKPRPRLIGQSVWLYEGRCVNLVQRFLLRRVDLELVHSRMNLAIAKEVRRDDRVFLAPFGTSVRHMPHERTQNADANPVVLAPGNDRHRDWSTLVNAARALPNVRFTIAADPRRVQVRDKPPNVEVKRFASVAELAAAYQAAAAVIIPLHENTHASGATVAMEAAWFERPVVAPNAGGIADYLDPASWQPYEVGDASSLAQAVRRAISEPLVYRSHLRQRGLTAHDYVGRYLLATAAVLGAPSSSRISSFAPVNLKLEIEDD